MKSKQILILVLLVLGLGAVVFISISLKNKTTINSKAADVDSSVTFTTGPEQLVFTSPIDYFPDEPYWGFNLGNGPRGLLTAGGGPGKKSETYFTKIGVNPVAGSLSQGNLQIASGLDSGSIGKFDEQGVWLRYFVVMPNGDWNGFYHGESHWKDGHVEHQSIAFAKSRDQGKNWTKPNYPNNQIIRGFNGLNAADPSFRTDSQYIYMYYSEKQPVVAVNATAGMAIARATIASGGVPGSWFKYYCNSSSCGFSQPGLDGKFTPVGPVFSNISYNTYLGRFISLGISRRMSSSLDGITWVNHGGPSGGDGRTLTNWYSGIVSLDGVSDKSAQTFWLYYIKFNSNDHSKRFLYRQLITLQKAGSTTPVPTNTPVVTPSQTPTSIPTGIPTINPTPTVKKGDANDDKIINNVDYLIWKQYQGLTSPTKSVHDGDFNVDGIVDGLDYAIWFNNFGK